MADKPLPEQRELVAAAAREDARPPPQVPDHQLLRCIGRGAYGEVWLARNVLGTYRAVKVVYRRNFENERPYEREFAGIQKFEPISRSHDGLVDILQVGRNDQAGYFYYVMELADDRTSGQKIDPERYEAKTLHSEIRQRGHLPIAECLPISLSLTSGLGHLHQEGLVHRDIKPSNIIFVKGVPKLADIGLVCGTEGTVSYVGTEGFTPPEGPGTPQADIYGLGKVFYEMSTGKDRQAFPDLPTELRADSERDALLEFNEVLVKACASEAGKRYQRAEEMEADLLLLQAGKSVKRQRIASWRLNVAKIAALLIAILALLFTLALYTKSQRARQRNLAGAESQSIAVLPFVNESPNKEDEYLSEAIPNEVIDALTPIMKVAARNSSFAFKGRNDDPRLIGQRLRVRTLLEGSVRKFGEKLYITTQMISAADGFQIMSKTYQRNIKDLPTIHNEIARHVAAALNVPLPLEEARHLTRKPTDNLAAYQAYLLGRQHWNQRMKPGQVQKASEYFARAIAQDTNFAQAYAGLAQTYGQRGYIAPGDLSPQQAFPEARKAASQALKLDDRLAEAHDALGWTCTHYEWNWAQAEREFQQAIELNPRYAEAHHSYSHLLMALGHASESLRESKLALELEPIDTVINLHLGWHYFQNRQFDELIEHLQKCIPMDPDFPMFYYLIGRAQEQKGEFAQAIANLRKANELSPGRPLMLAALGSAYAAAGRTNEAQQIIQQMNERARTQYVDQAEVAFVYIRLHDKDQAFACLTNQALADRSGWLTYLNVEPQFDSLRDDPRFNDLLKAVGLPVPAASNSVAVLPFEDLSRDRSQDNYVAGLTDTLINKLAGLQALDVRSRQRVMPYEGITNTSILEIARDLRVRFLVRGVVQHSPGWLAINLQLLRPPSEAPVWVERFDEQESNALKLQSKVAEHLARALQVNVTPQEQQRLRKTPAVQPQALALYYAGKAHVRQENSKDNDEAISLLEKAVQLDPGFGDAYAELANAYVVKSFFFDASTEWKTKAKAAVQTALALDPDSARAHLANAHLIWTPSPTDFPQEKTVEALQRALKLNPNLDVAHEWLARVYLHVGLLDKALAEIHRAIEIDPGNFMAHYRLGVILHLQGKYQEAWAKLQSVPDDTNPELLGRQIPWTLFQLNRSAEARARLQKFRDKYKEDRGGQLVSMEAMIDADEGKAREADEKIRQALQNPQVGHFHHTAYNVACAYALLNRQSDALGKLKEASETGYPCYPLFQTDRCLNNLRTNSQFISFMNNLKLKWEYYKATFN